MQKSLLLFFSLIACSNVSASEQFQCNWQNRDVTISTSGVQVSQGNDETLQSVAVKVWGTDLREKFCHQADGDTEDEFVLISRNVGTGPYYRIQIIDFREHGILTWSYASDGKPRIDEQIIWLGKLESGYTGANSIPTYRPYQFGDNGLKLVDDAN